MSVITTFENGKKSGRSATLGRDFFGNLFEIMEIHPNESIPAV